MKNKRIRQIAQDIAFTIEHDSMLDREEQEQMIYDRVVDCINDVIKEFLLYYE